jgi:hypothetical protein
MFAHKLALQTEQHSRSTNTNDHHKTTSEVVASGGLRKVTTTAAALAIFDRVAQPSPSRGRMKASLRLANKADGEGKPTACQ